MVVMIIVIDGPAGSGKSSTAKAVADRLGLQYLDSGALYRIVTLAWIEADRDPALFDRLGTLSVDFEYRGGMFHVRLDGRDRTADIRSSSVNEAVSLAAADVRVRSRVNAWMRERIRNRACIADGRDLGTAVFPDADLKIFMDASPRTRAERRALELRSAGEPVDVSEVLEGILERDRLDSSREADPLRMASDAVRIDTDAFDFDQQVDHVAKLVAEHVPAASAPR